MTEIEELDRIDWSSLQDTYWYVPPASLPALQLDPDSGTLNWVIDQTVWHITGYREGYFWGVSSTLIQHQGQDQTTRATVTRNLAATSGVVSSFTQQLIGPAKL